MTDDELKQISKQIEDVLNAHKDEVLGRPRNTLDALIVDLIAVRKRYGGNCRVNISYDGGYEVYPFTVQDLEEEFNDEERGFTFYVG